MSSGAKKPTSPPSTPSAGEARQTVLIIDDEKDVHYSFRRLLEKEPL